MPLPSRSYGAVKGCFYSQIGAGFDPFNFDLQWLVLSDRPRDTGSWLVRCPSPSQRAPSQKGNDEFRVLRSELTFSHEYSAGRALPIVWGSVVRLKSRRVGILVITPNAAGCDADNGASFGR